MIEFNLFAGGVVTGAFVETLILVILARGDKRKRKMPKAKEDPLTLH